MKIETNISALYKPVQPTVKQAADKVIYTEFLPDIRLQPYIHCYWQLKTTEALTETFNYRIVADGCIDIYLELHNPQKNYLMGFSKTFIEFPLDNTFNYVGIRFLPTMFPQIFKINAMELSNRYENLQSVVPGLSNFISKHFKDTMGKEAIKKLFDDYLLNLIAKTSIDKDSRLYGAMEVILKNYAVIDIEKDLETGISSRQLRRLFEFYIGATPKTFSKVVRFQHILSAKPSIQSLRQDKLFLEAGYYDQSHFIKEFKNFYGVTPGKAFRS